MNLCNLIHTNYNNNLLNFFQTISFLSIRNEVISYAIKKINHNLFKIIITEKIDKKYNNIFIKYIDYFIYFQIDNDTNNIIDITVKKIFIDNDKIIGEKIRFIHENQKILNFFDFITKKFLNVINTEHKILKYV